MTLRSKAERRKAPKRPRPENQHVGTCSKCGLPFNNKPIYSVRTGSTFVPATCITCWKAAKAAKKPDKHEGYCADCGHYLQKPGPGHVLTHARIDGRDVPIRNYCRARRAQPTGPHPFFQSGFQDSAPCNLFTPKSTWEREPAQESEA